MDIHRIALVAVITVSCGLCFSAEPNQSNWRATGRNGAVVAGKPGSASAGLTILRQEWANATLRNSFATQHEKDGKSLK